MRIALLCTTTTLHQQGGTEVHAETLAAAAAAKGHSVHIITSYHPDRPESELRDGIRTHYLPGTNFAMSRKDLPAWWEQSSRKISELSAGEGLDIIWAENYAGQYYARRLRRSVGVPIISFIGVLGILQDIKSNFARISTPSEALYFATRYLAQAAVYLAPWQYNTMRYSDHVVAVSDASRKALLREVTIPENRITTVYPLIDPGLFLPDPGLRANMRGALGLRPADRVLLMSGVAYKQKGFEIGLRAFFDLRKSVPDLKLIIAGDGPERPRLQKMAADRGLEKSVIFTGALPNSGMPGVYNAADIYVNPTIRWEGLAIVNVEAMACALPVVTSKIGGTAETIEDEFSGFFTRPGDSSDLAQKTLKILETASLAAEMGARARKRAVELFSSEVSINKVLEISDKVIKNTESLT